MKKSDRERRTDASTCKMMPESYTPGAYEVLIGRGRRCTMHWGNQRFRAMIASELPGYTAAQDCKRQKSSIIGGVLADIQHHSPHAGFVKKDVGSGRWLSLTDAASRVTIAQAFRDALNDTYRSSKHSKQVKRRTERTERKTPRRSSKQQARKQVHVVPELQTPMTTNTEDSQMPPLRAARTVSMEMATAESRFQDSFTMVAFTVEDVVSDDEPSESSEAEILDNEEFDALFDAFAEDEVNMEDNPFEPLPLSLEPLSLFPALPSLSPLRRYSISINPVFKRNSVSLSNNSSRFGSAVPFRDVRAAMTA